MTTEMIILQIVCAVDDGLEKIGKERNARLYPSEVVTIGILFALKGGHFRAFYRWLKRDRIYALALIPLPPFSRMWAGTAKRSRA